MAGESAQDFRQRGGWFPGQDDLEAWIENRRGRLPENLEGPLRPAVEALRDLIDGDPVVRMLFTRMIEEVPAAKPYRNQHIQSVDELLWLIDDILGTAPAFGQHSMVSTPLAAILDWTMGTPSGYAAYRDPRVNAAFGQILDAWCEFFNSADSLTVLNDSADGWKSDKAQEVVGMDQFAHNPDDQYWGYRSWNDFFTRRFRDGQRPVESRDDDSVILSACESTPYKISRGVRRRDEFWVKNQPYSLQDMLANDPSVDMFEGGTVYQAFSAQRTTTAGMHPFQERSSAPSSNPGPTSRRRTQKDPAQPIRPTRKGTWPTWPPARSSSLKPTIPSSASSPSSRSG